MQRFPVQRLLALRYAVALTSGGLVALSPLWAADFNAATKAGGGRANTHKSSPPPTSPSAQRPGEQTAPTMRDRLGRFLPGGANSRSVNHAAGPSNIPPAERSANDVQAAPAAGRQASATSAVESPPLDEENAQNIETIRYLASLGCEACYPDTESALLAFLESENEQVRFEAARALGELAGRSCCWCNAPTCASDEGLKRLEEVGYGRKENGRFRERSLRVRKLARLAARNAAERIAPPSVDGLAPAAEQLADNGPPQRPIGETAVGELKLAEQNLAAQGGAMPENAGAADEPAERLAITAPDASVSQPASLRAADLAERLSQATSELKFDSRTVEPATPAAEVVAQGEPSGAAEPAGAGPAVEAPPPSAASELVSDSPAPNDTNSTGDAGPPTSAIVTTTVAAAEPAANRLAASPADQAATPHPDLAAALAKSTPAADAWPLASTLAPPGPIVEPPLADKVLAKKAPAASSEQVAPRTAIASQRAIPSAAAPVGLLPSRTATASKPRRQQSSRRTQDPSAIEAPVEIADTIAVASPPPAAAPDAAAPSPETTVRIDTPPRGLESSELPAEPAPPDIRTPSRSLDDGTQGLATSRRKPAAEVLAEVNGEPITSDEVFPSVAAQLKRRGAGMDPESLEEMRQQLLSAELGRAIDRKLLCQAARKHNDKNGVVSTSFAGKTGPAAAAEETKLADQWLRKAVPLDSRVTTAELNAFQRGRGQPPTEATTARCEIYTAPKTHFHSVDHALAALDYAQARATGERPPFPRDADPAAVQRRSFRALNSREIASGPLADAVFGLPAGGISKVVEDARGWHVVHMIERHRAASVAISPAEHERLRAAVAAQRRRQQEQAYVSQLRRQARVWTAVDTELR